MNLVLSEAHQLLVDSFDRFFQEMSSMARVRRAEPAGFDPELWQALGGMGALGMRLPGEEGGLFDAILVMEQAGRWLCSAPLAETIVAARLLALAGGPEDLLRRAIAGEAVLTLALAEVEPGRTQLVPGGGVADAILYFEGHALRLAKPSARGGVPLNHGSMPVASHLLSGTGTILIAGAAAREAYQAAREEWRLLTASALAALARRAIDLAADYAREREQFGRPIGSFQAISHPLAESVTDIVGARLAIWSAVSKIAQGRSDAASAVSAAWWWTAAASGRAVARALHSFGGYGLSNEYDIQLYHRRAKAMALIAGDPRDALVELGERRWLGRGTALPEAGEIEIDFDPGDEAHALAEETRAFFESRLTPEWREKAHFSFDGHDPALNRDMGAARLLFPTWPVAQGGRGASRFAAAAALAVWHDFDVTIHAQGVSDMIGRVIMRFGSDWARQEVLPRIAVGEIITSLGYTEPSSGSDVFAARTRAVRDGAEWVINGQKMFTSGANLAKYVLLLTRTDPEAPKHNGITLFLVPLDAPGVEIRPIGTFQEERTNATFYSDVRVSDAHRLGEVNGGQAVLAYALTLEQGGGGFLGPHRQALEAAVAWARQASRDGRSALEQPRVLERLAMAAARLDVSALLYQRSLWLLDSGNPNRAAGPMSKLFASEAFLADATDLFDLAAPETLLRGKHGTGVIELAHRHAAGTTIYGGTSEVQRSQIAEGELRLPRSR